MFLKRAMVMAVLMFILLGAAGNKTGWGPYYPRTWTTEDMSGEIGSDHNNILGITLRIDFVQDVFKKLGQTAVFDVNPGSKPDVDPLGQSICYIAQDTSDNTVIIFLLGPGSTETIDAFIVTTKDYIPFCAKCTKSSLVKKDIATKGGITLGMTKERFMSIFGKPTEMISDDGIAYRYIRTFKFTDEVIKKLEKKNLKKQEYPSYDVYIISGIQAHFLKGKLIWFKIYETWG